MSQLQTNIRMDADMVERLERAWRADLSVRSRNEFLVRLLDKHLPKLPKQQEQPTQ